MSSTYNSNNLKINSCDNDYGQFWDTETQTPLYIDMSQNDDDDEYDFYIDNYNMLLTEQEHMLEYDYEKIKMPIGFTTIGFILFIVKTVAKCIYP